MSMLGAADRSMQATVERDFQELRVSVYDRTASLLIALLVLFGVSVTALLVVWLSAQVLVRHPSVPVTVETIQQAGGNLDGVLGESLALEGPQTNEIGNDPTLITPMVQRSLDLVAESLSSREADLSDPILTDDLVSGGLGGSKGDGRQPGLGQGGDGSGIARQQRWEISFPEGRTLEQYGAYLDQYGVELAAIGNGPDVQYAAGFAGGKPRTRTGRREAEQRLYMSWTRGEIRVADLALLKRAGISTEGRLVVQFIPAEFENLLASKERAFANREAEGIRRTKFAVQFRDDRYDIAVSSQTPL